MRGGIPSPPIALEESREVRAVKVSSYDISIEQRELLSKEERPLGQSLQLEVKTEWKNQLKSSAFSDALVAETESWWITLGILLCLDKLLM